MHSIVVLSGEVMKDAANFVWRCTVYSLSPSEKPALVCSPSILTHTEKKSPTSSESRPVTAMSLTRLSTSPVMALIPPLAASSVCSFRAMTSRMYDPASAKESRTLAWVK